MIAAHAIAEAVQGGSLSAVMAVQNSLDRIARHDSRLNAFSSVLAERALNAAARVDARRAAGFALGPLAGVPFAVKNLVDLKGVPTLAGSRINADHLKAPSDALVVERLEAAGAVCVGALNMGEYAYDFTGRNFHYGPTRNPHDLSRMTGGSSSGSGSAVAAGLVPIALGSDTNGSIRVPASLCGTFGLKPTYGRLSRRGTFPFCASLDHLGALARNVRDLAISYDTMQGPDLDDPACGQRPIEPVSPHLNLGLHNLRIGVAGGHFAQGGTPECHAAVAKVAEALEATTIVMIPEAERARAAAFIITSAEGANLHLPRSRLRAADFDPETRDRFLAGALAPVSWYIQAQRFRRWYRSRVLEVFRDIDIILAPSAPTTAPLIEQITFALDGVEQPIRASMGVYTQPISFIGLPVAAVPIVRERGELPVGVQVIAAPWREDLVLRVAAWLEKQGVVAAPVANTFE